MRKLLAAMLCAAAACSGSGDKKDEQPTVATPAFTPAGGTYAAPQSVAITCATAGATIRYTTDGTAPTATSLAYSGPVAVSTTGTTFKAYATLAGQTDSAVATATYVLQAAAPVFAPQAGTYTAQQAVTLTSATPTAVIRYTTDGSTPTASSPTYSTPISVTTVTPTTIKAIATRSGFADSAVASATYVINPEAAPAATPTFSPPAGTYTSAQSVTISTTTQGATIYYTTDGADPTTSSTVFTAPVTVSATTTLKAIATAPGFTRSAVAAALYTINLPQPVATPVFSPVPGTYNSPQSVSITCATNGATIYYTTNGAEPTTGSTPYTTPLAISSTTTLKAIATAPGRAQSAIASGTYTISSGTSFATLCAAVTTSQKNLLSSCLKVNPALLDAPGAFQLDFCTDLQKEIDAGRIAYSATQGSACLTGFQALTCNDVLPEGGFPTVQACQNALTGTVGTGGACYVGDACQAGYCTSDITQSCPGTCQPFAQLDQSCQSAQCADGLACAFSGSTFTCKTASGLNGACPCQDAYWCDSSGGSPGVCRAFRGDGGACSASGVECATGTECVGASVFPPVAGTCRTLVGGGAACGASAPCGLGYTCPAGTCVSLPPVNQPCVQGTGILDCIGGYCPATASPTCQAYKAVSATCIAAYECASFQCSGTPAVCQPLSCAAP